MTVQLLLFCVVFVAMHWVMPRLQDYVLDWVDEPYEELYQSASTWVQSTYIATGAHHFLLAPGGGVWEFLHAWVVLGVGFLLLMLAFLALLAVDVVFVLWIVDHIHGPQDALLTRRTTNTLMFLLVVLQVYLVLCWVH